MKYLATALMIFSLCIATPVMAAAPSGTVTIHVTPAVEAEAAELKLWIPYPLSDESQTISDVTITGNHSTSGIYRDPASEAVYLYATWPKRPETPSLTLSFHITQTDRSQTIGDDTGAPFPVDVAKYLESTPFVPSDSMEMKRIAGVATQGKSGTLEKARGVYDWVVDNTFRDPAVKGCGLADPSRTLNACKGGGKCADLSAVFVTIARAAGIPARDVYGLRLSTPKEGDITSAFHCWAEFYLPDTGWVMVDPADVRKMMLVHNLELKDAGEWREFFWAGDNLFRVTLEKDARGVVFQGDTTRTPLNYFMYPQATVDGNPLDRFDAKAFSYNVTFNADKG